MIREKREIDEIDSSLQWTVLGIAACARLKIRFRGDDVRHAKAEETLWQYRKSTRTSKAAAMA